mgnify:CR=1 FL=1
MVKAIFLISGISVISNEATLYIGHFNFSKKSNAKTRNLYRHGDLLITRINAVPQNAISISSKIIAEGEVSAPHSANVALPDDIVPVTSRTVPLPQKQPEVPTMLDLDDLDL